MDIKNGKPASFSSKTFNVFSVILIISIALGVSKKKSHKHNRTTLSGHDNGKYVDIGPEEGTKFRGAKEGFLLKGTLRQIFALETAFADAWNNVVCSPVSALLPLGKLALGAEGRSRQELFQMIGVPGNKELSTSLKKTIKNLEYLPGVKLDLASRIYVSDTAELSSKFLKASKDIFHSGVERVSFKNSRHAADKINGWVSRQTKGMIPLLLSPDQISPDSSLILVNAIYFRGKWKDPFNSVGVGDFYAPSGLKKVQMMTQTGYFNYVKSDILNAQIVEIPYEGNKASFVIVLPNDKNDLPMLLNQLKLAPKLLNDALKKLKFSTVILSIPKFTITTTLDLKEMYGKIGIKHILSNKSGLTEIVKGQELKISNAVQKAVIEVHERGTDAAAASGVLLLKKSGAPKDLTPELFYADHPFLFYVQATSEQLFGGIYSEP